MGWQPLGSGAAVRRDEPVSHVVDVEFAAGIILDDVEAQAQARGSRELLKHLPEKAQVVKKPALQSIRSELAFGQA
jgi:hypothetical protein